MLDDDVAVGVAGGAYVGMGGEVMLGVFGERTLPLVLPLPAPLTRDAMVDTSLSPLVGGEAEPDVGV